MKYWLLTKKWLISGVYIPQTIDEKKFNEDFIKTCDQITSAYDNSMFIGDLNYDMLVSDKSSPFGITKCMWYFWFN